MKTASALPDAVLHQIERLARRHNGWRGAIGAGGVAGYLRYARAVVADALEDVARAPVMLPPP